MLIGVAALHLAAIGGYYGLDVPNAPERFQRIYAWVWMGCTVALIVVGLQRIKRARGRTTIRRLDQRESELQRDGARRDVDRPDPDVR